MVEHEPRGPGQVRPVLLAYSPEKLGRERAAPHLAARGLTGGLGLPEAPYGVAARPALGRHLPRRLATPLPGVGHGGLAREAALVGVDHGHLAACFRLLPPAAACFRLVEQGQLLFKKGDQARLPAGVKASPQPLPPVAGAGSRSRPVAGPRGARAGAVAAWLLPTRHLLFWAAASRFGGRPVRVPSAKPASPRPCQRGSQSWTVA